MLVEKNPKSAGKVFCVYIAYLIGFGLFAGSAASSSKLLYPLLFLSLLYVSSTFGFVYRHKDTIKHSPANSLLVYILSVGLTLLPFKWVLEFYFYPVLLLEFVVTGMTFAYTYGFKRKIDKVPWQYIFPLFLIFLFILTVLIMMT